MINLKNPSSSFLTSRSHHKVDVSVQEDDGGAFWNEMQFCGGSGFCF